MRFDMGGGTLSQLTKKTSASSDELGALVRELADAAAPLQGRFNGAARAVFDGFHAQSDRIAAELDAALRSVLGGIAMQDAAFLEGEQAMVEETKQAASRVDFDAARFGAGR